LGTLRVGGVLGGTGEAFAAISEPRKVATATTDCVAYAGCTICGDGQLGQGELCDPGTDPRCASDCKSEASLTECVTDDVCPPGQGCPVEPNGDAFGAASWRKFCVPELLCIKTSTPAC